jgi:hypothetical protein
MGDSKQYTMLYNNTTGFAVRLNLLGKVVKAVVNDDIKYGTNPVKMFLGQNATAEEYELKDKYSAVFLEPLIDIRDSLGGDKTTKQKFVKMARAYIEGLVEGMTKGNNQIVLYGQANNKHDESVNAYAKWVVETATSFSYGGPNVITAFLDKMDDLTKSLYKDGSIPKPELSYPQGWTPPEESPTRINYWVTTKYAWLSFVKTADEWILDKHFGVEVTVGRVDGIKVLNGESITISK